MWWGLFVSSPGLGEEGEEEDEEDEEEKGWVVSSQGKASMVVCYWAVI